MGEPGHLSNKVLSFKAPLQFGIQKPTVPDQVHKAVIFCNYVEALPVRSQRPYMLNHS